MPKYGTNDLVERLKPTKRERSYTVPDVGEVLAIQMPVDSSDDVKYMVNWTSDPNGWAGRRITRVRERFLKPRGKQDATDRD